MAKSTKSTRSRKPAATKATKQNSSTAKRAGDAAKKAAQTVDEKPAEIVEEVKDQVTETASNASPEAGDEGAQTSGDEATDANQKPRTAAKVSDPAPDTAPNTSPDPDLDTAPIAMTGPPTEETAAPHRSGFLPLALGGVVAAGLGFGAAQFLPQLWPQSTNQEVVELRSTLSAQTAEIADLRAAFQSGELTADLTGTVDALQSDTSAGLEQVTTRIGELAVRLDELEKRPIEGSAASEAAVTAYRRDVEALKQQLDGLETATAGQVDLAQKAAEDARLNSARATIVAAMESGEPFGAALTELADLSTDPTPDALTAIAETGVATAAQLRSDFPAAARASLAAATEAEVEDGSVSRFEGFLRKQLNARSLNPREGDGADAVLSRAEAALQSDDLMTALSELDALPGSAAPAMADWAEAARTRAAALAAVSNLTDTVSGN